MCVELCKTAVDVPMHQVHVPMHWVCTNMHQGKACVSGLCIAYALYSLRGSNHTCTYSLPCAMAAPDCLGAPAATQISGHSMLCPYSGRGCALQLFYEITHALVGTTWGNHCGPNLLEQSTGAGNQSSIENGGIPLHY